MQSVFWLSEFILSNLFGAKASQSINRKIWTHLEILQSDDPDYMKSSEIVIVFGINFHRTMESDLSKALQAFWEREKLSLTRRLSIDDVIGVQKILNFSCKIQTLFKNKNINQQNISRFQQ